jgi:hypothetical protein
MTRPRSVRITILAMESMDLYVIVPLALTALITGIIQSLVRWLGTFAGADHAARLRGRPQRCCRSLRMRARSRRCSARTSGCLALALRHRR